MQVRGRAQRTLGVIRNMPQPDRLVNTLRQAARAFRDTPGRTGRLVRLPAGAEVLVAGDMHGSVENFRLLLGRANLGGNPQRHLVLQEVVHGPFRYPQGGDKSHQLLDVVAALKCQFPDRVHFLLGNHELAQWRGHRIAKGLDNQNDLFALGVENAYADSAAQVLEAYNALFAAADLAIVTANRVWLSHSLPSSRQLPAFDPAVLERDELRPEDLELGGAVHALVWGRDVSEANAVAFLARRRCRLAHQRPHPLRRGLYDSQLTPAHPRRDGISGMLLLVPNGSAADAAGIGCGCWDVVTAFVTAKNVGSCAWRMTKNDVSDASSVRTSKNGISRSNW